MVNESQTGSKLNVWNAGIPQLHCSLAGSLTASDQMLALDSLREVKSFYRASLRRILSLLLLRFRICLDHVRGLAVAGWKRIERSWNATFPSPSLRLRYSILLASSWACPTLHRS